MFTRRIPPEIRFREKVALPDANGCLIWVGAKDTGGYGRFFDGSKVTGAHQFSYELANGPAPDGYDIDHLCRVKACVNPLHLEAVTHLENVRRGKSAEAQKARNAARTSCKYGHEFTPENTYLHPSSARVCLTCRRAYQKAWRRARKACE